MSVTRLGYASINVIDMQAAIDHYTQIVGLRLVERDPEGRAYFQAADDQDHHCLVLNAAGRAGLEHVGFKVNDPADLGRAADLLSTRGITSRLTAADSLCGQGSTLRFTAPSGHGMALYYHSDKIGYEMGMTNPDPVSGRFHAGDARLDHVVLACQQPHELSAFLIHIFGFFISEQVNAPSGEMVGAFLSCTNKMHDVAITPGPNGGFHHMAFVLDSRSAVIACTDMLKQRCVPTFELGLTRHGIAGVTTVYFYDPSGNRNEFCHGAYLTPGMADKVPPVVWEPHIFPGATFYYEASVPAEFLVNVT